MNTKYATMLMNGGCHRSPRGNFLYSGTDAVGTRVGIVLATFNVKFGEYALNQPDFYLLLAAKREGRIDVAFVVETKDWNYGDERPAEEVLEIVKDLPTKTGPLGQFWHLPSFTKDITDPFKVSVRALRPSEQDESDDL
jgi:hypothetical protein